MVVAGAPAAASASGAAPKKDGPQARAENHLNKKKAKENRKTRSPGPGAYSPTPISTNGLSTKGTKNQGSSFISKSRRSVEALGSMEMGDPGSYDPYTLTDLSSTSKKSFAKSNRAGHGDFGGKEKREMAVEIMGEGTPGPGAYTKSGDMLRSGKKAALAAMDTGEKMPSSSFQSKSVQRGKTQNEHVPGAGAYTPNMGAIESNTTNPGPHFKAQGQRFEAVKQLTDPMVGPGSYESHLERSLEVSVSKAVSKASRANPGFGTLTLAHELPFYDAVQDAADDPGPGAYETAKSELLQNGGGHRSAFKSGSRRSVEALGSMEMGDPGSYDPYTLTDLSSTSKKSFAKSNRAGHGDFGGKEKREMAVEIMGEGTPGPGAYTKSGDMLRSGKKAALAAMDTGEKMPSSSFQSKSVQRAKEQNLHVPGAGAYTPNWTQTMDAKMSVNSGAGMRGKGARFSGADSLARDKNLEPGPGAYETEILRTGGRSNLSAYDTGELMPSASFASDSIREMPWPTAGGVGVAAKAAAS